MFILMDSGVRWLIFPLPVQRISASIYLQAFICISVSYQEHSISLKGIFGFPVWLDVLSPYQSRGSMLRNFSYWSAKPANLALPHNLNGKKLCGEWDDLPPGQSCCKFQSDSKEQIYFHFYLLLWSIMRFWTHQIENFANRRPKFLCLKKSSLIKQNEKKRVGIKKSNAKYHPSCFQIKSVCACVCVFELFTFL